VALSDLGEDIDWLNVALQKPLTVLVEVPVELSDCWDESLNVALPLLVDMVSSRDPFERVTEELSECVTDSDTVRCMDSVWLSVDDRPDERDFVADNATDADCDTDSVRVALARDSDGDGVTVSDWLVVRVILADLTPWVTERVKES